MGDQAHLVARGPTGKEGDMRGVFRADWDGLYLRVRRGDSEALVTLRNEAIRRVARCRVARCSSIPPWQREELAEEAFDRTQSAFPKLETWERAFAYMAKTMNRLIFRLSVQGQRIPLDAVGSQLIDPEAPRRVLETDIADFALEKACGLPERQYQQFRTLLQACWGRAETRRSLSRKAGVSLRTWARCRASLLVKLRKSLSQGE
jgi:hypothetical protein